MITIIIISQDIKKQSLALMIDNNNKCNNQENAQNLFINLTRYPTRTTANREPIRATHIYTETNPLTARLDHRKLFFQVYKYLPRSDYFRITGKPSGM